MKQPNLWVDSQNSPVDGLVSIWYCMYCNPWRFVTSSPAPEPRAAEHARSVPPAGRDCPGMATYGKVWQGMARFRVVFCCFLLFFVVFCSHPYRDHAGSRGLSFVVRERPWARCRRGKHHEKVDSSSHLDPKGPKAYLTSALRNQFWMKTWNSKGAILRWCQTVTEGRPSISSLAGFWI